MMSPRERYMNDPAFHMLVSTLYNEIVKATFTPTEIREAAMLAQILYEERRPAPRKIPQQVTDWLDDDIRAAYTSAANAELKDPDR